MAAKKSGGMGTYLLRRLLLMIPTFLGVTLCVFLVTQLVPGGPVDQLRMQLTGGGGGGEGGGGGGGSESRSAQVSEKDLESLKKFYGFDRPLHERYIKYMLNLGRLNFGDSLRYMKPADGLIAQRLPISLYYGIVTTILVYGICIPLGIVKALSHRTFLDTSTSVLIFCGYAIPGYALGAVLLSIFSVKYGLFPLGGFKGDSYESLSLFGKIKDVVHHSILPLICWMIGSFAFMTMLMKNSLMENMSADFVKTALAKGLTANRAVFVHALRNSLIPMATSFGNNISLIVAGSLLVERVFNIQGIGLMFFEAVQARDYPIVMALTVISSLLLLFGNLLSDLCVAMVDPRVRFG